MSKELEVRREELLPMLRACVNCAGCKTCRLNDAPQCRSLLMAAAADEIEELRTLEEAVGRMVFLSERTGARTIISTMYRVAEMIAARFPDEEET